MLKQLFYLGVACMGLGVVGGNRFEGGVESVVEEFPAIEHELSDKPLIPKGSLFVPVEINMLGRSGVYRGPDGFYYKVRYSLFDDSVYVEDVSEREIEF